MTELEYLKLVCGNIRKIRKDKGIKQNELAFKIGIEPTNLRRIESAKSIPTFRTLCKIATALEEDVKNLIPDGRPIY
jgi:transcriptional regulator with XRE-family HTH domain